MSWKRSRVVAPHIYNLGTADCEFWSVWTEKFLNSSAAVGFSQRPYRWIALEFVLCMLLRSWNRASLDVYLYNQRYGNHTTFPTTISAVHVSGGISAHHQELIKLYVQPWVLSCFPAVYRWCGWVGTVQLKLNSFISSWWWAEKPPETCRALIILKNIV